jgi:predicted Fe-Mo cluster-binding NifX family protein
MQKGNPSGMKRIVVPIFQQRVSPVLDSCRRILVIDIENGAEVDRKEIYLDNLTLGERISILRRLKASAVICGGISETLSRMLSDTPVRLINGVAGSIDEVVCAYLNDEIESPRYFMPGFSPPRE